MSEQKNQALVDMVGEAARHAPLVIVCATDDKQAFVHSKLTQVFLNGQNISRYLQNVEVLFACDKPVGARMDYIGAAVIVTDGGELTMQQAEIHATCGECHEVLQGEGAEAIVVDVTPLGSVARKRLAIGMLDLRHHGQVEA